MPSNDPGATMKRACTISCLLLFTLSAFSQVPAGRLQLTEKEITDSLGTEWFGVYFLGKKVGFGRDVLEAKDKASYLVTREFNAKFTSQGKTSEAQFRETYEFDAASPHILRRASSTESNGESKQVIELIRRDKDVEVITTVDR